MALTHRTGFDGVWTANNYALGESRHGFRMSGLTVTDHANARTVQVATGALYAFGGSWTLDAIETVTFSAPASGSRWDLVAIRLDYAAKTATVVGIENGTLNSVTIPSGRNTSIGTTYDVPLALIENTSASTDPQSIYDMRISYDGPMWWIGKLTTTISHVTARYKSFDFSLKDSGENLTPLFSGHSILLPPGVYAFDSQLTWAVNGTGQRIINAVLNPSATSVDATTNVTGTFLRRSERDANSDIDEFMTFPTIIRRIALGDKFMLQGFQNSGASLNLISDSSRSFLSIRRVGD